MTSSRVYVSILFVAVFLGGLLLVACSSASTSATTLDVQLKDFAFDSTVFTVPAGKEITLNLKNIGANEHEFVIMKAGTQATAPFDDDDEGNVYWEAETESGASGSFTFTAPAAGTYQIVCGIPGHIEQGMLASLTVTE